MGMGFSSDIINVSEIEALMAEWQVPGLSVGVVQNGEVRFLQGFGHRDLASGLEMTANTVLPIGSASKSFTALALGMLADEGVFNWDTPVQAYIPWFKMYDAQISGRVTARDLLCHRTGLPSHDVHGVFCTKTRREMVEDIRYLQPSADFRTRLQYQNQMVALAGYLVEVISGKTWEGFVRERVFQKLQMNSSFFSINDMQKQKEFSKPYIPGPEGPAETNYILLNAMGPAGSINSSAADMVEYLKLQLGNGKYGGEPLVSEANLAQMHAPQMLGSPYFWKFDEFQSTNYGFGWFVDIYRGHKLISHGGNTRGFSSLVSLLPEKDLGIVALSNMDTSFMVYAMTYAMLDRALGAPTVNWSARIKTEIEKIFGGMRMMMEQRIKDKIPGTFPSHPLAAYAGTYVHPAYGTFMVAVDGDKLRGTYNEGDVDMTHYHYDTFDILIKAMNLPYLVTFQTNTQGVVDSISAPFEPSPGVDPIILKKQVQ